MVNKKTKIATGIGSALVIALLARGLITKVPAASEPSAAASEAKPNTVALSDKQMKWVSVATIGSHDFAVQSDAVGYIDFDQDKNVPVFSPWTGRIVSVAVKAGDDVKKGQTLFTIDSPDLLNAESTLISTAGVNKLTATALERARGLHDTQAMAQKDYDQAVSDHQTAEANYKAARDAVRIFGRTDAEMDAMIASHKTNAELRIVSPINGRVTARNAAEGLLVQPGNAPAPITVADINKLWMVANVSESDVPRIAPGQTVSVHVEAYPQHKFTGELSNVGAMLDPNTHRITVHADIDDPKHLLRPQMLATFEIQTAKPVRSAAIPLSGVVREGDGTMVAFVTRDKHVFERRVIQIGAQQDGLDQVLQGLAPGEMAATNGAILLSNALALKTR